MLGVKAVLRPGSGPKLSRFAHYLQGQSPGVGVREYFYYIDHQGMLYMDDARIKNFTSCFKEKHFLKFFFTRLKVNDTGRYAEEFPYLSPCGRERNFIRCDDLPIVYTQIFHEDREVPVLSYGHAGLLLTVPFQPAKICMVPSTGRVYHPAPKSSGGVGLISDKLSMQWTSEKRFSFTKGEDNPPTEFEWKNQVISLDNSLALKISS